MKKTFRKAIAVLLAVLMVAFSVPFSALAGTPDAPDMFGETNYTVTKNRKWWVDDGVDTSLSKLQSTPEYWSYNSDETYNQMGSWSLSFGGRVEDYGNSGYEDHRNDYKPVIAATVSSQGTNAGMKEAIAKVKDKSDTNAIKNYAASYFQNYYGMDASHTYEAVKTAKNILNPATLKAGDRIAVTVEFGGFDVLQNGQFKGKFNKEYLKAAAYSSKPSRGDTWKAVSSGAAGCIADGTQFYPTALAFAGNNVNVEDGTFYGAVTGKAAVAGDQSVSNFIGTADGVKPFGKYGIVSFVYSFEVLQDCDLSDVFKFDTDIAGTEFEPYYRTSLDGTGEPNNTNAVNPELFLITHDDTKSTFANWALIWTDYAKDSTPEAKTYTITFNDINGKTVDTQTVKEGETPTVPSTNTAATVNYKSDNKHEVTTYSWPEVSAATADTTYKEVATTAEENCDITYAETSKHTLVSGTVLKGTCTKCGHEDTQTKDDKLDGTAYYAALDAAKAVDGSKYTAESYAKVTAALEANAQAKVEAYTDQAQVTAAATALEDAVKGLVLVEVYTITFTNAAGTVVDTQKLAAGATPVAPKTNTADTAATPAGNKQHSHTTYSWPAVSAVTANANYDEVANVVTEDCTKGTPVVTEPTLDKPGSEVTSCTICGQVLETKVLPQLKGYDITVAKTAYGTTTLNSEDATNGKTTKVPANSTVTLTAQANKGAEFVGWKVAQKLVSTDETYSFTAVANTEVTPVFTETAESTFVVVFIDMYGNVVSTQEVTSGANIKVPATAPIYPGYTFKGWTLTNDEITALKEGTTIRAIYEKDATQTYTVKAAGATITVNGTDYTDKAENVAYDAKVTVTKAGATSWAVNGATVGYGESYSFFCASDIELTAVTKADDTSKTQVAIVSTTRPSATDCDVLFVATRTLADNEKNVVSQGFVYGKNAVASDLTLENVGKTASGTNPGKVKVAYNGNGEQFGLNYGITAMTGTAAARAFVVTKDADGNVHTYYSEASLYNY